MGRAHEAEKRACAGVPGCERLSDEQEADTAMDMRSGKEWQGSRLVRDRPLPGKHFLLRAWPHFLF